MKLQALRLHGFKSFADRTEIRFHDGITTIVGPNGCGKSNISDAIRWVLGEQRPTAIRGAKMEEAIFQGTVNRRPVNRGSVMIAVSNEAGALPVPFEEVEISRTVYRDGGSEYSLNRSSCRLKDIQELCRDTGLGANAYAVIESRMIDAILSDRAEERRGLFEEAAGIGKYKDRRKAASRRLERAQIDLQRLEDVIGEVQSKVRSLARQKGRAQRYQELRERRLSVEIAVVREEMGGLEGRLEQIRAELREGENGGEGLQAELGTAEARFEEFRIEQVAAEKARSEAGRRLDEIRRRLVEWERELAVADERMTYATRRTEQVEKERTEAGSRLTGLDGAGSEEKARVVQLEGELEALRKEQERHQEVAAEVRARLGEARTHVEGLEARERELARRGAQLEGDAEAAEEQSKEMALRLERLGSELEEAVRAAGDLADQGDLFSDRLSELEEAVGERRRAVEVARERAEGLRERLQDIRRRELAAADHASSLAAEVSTLERMERDQEGVDPVVRAVLEQDDEGVLGILTDFLEGPGSALSAVEGYLGALTRALVVRDEETAERLIRWFREEWEGGGGVVILPVDRAPKPPKDGTLLSRLSVHGDGAPWVRVLLGGVDYDESGDGIAGSSSARSVVFDSGAVREATGVLRVGNPLGATGILERRERLKDLRAALQEREEERDARRREREEAEQHLEEEERALEEARSRLHEAEDERRTAAADETAHSERKVRMERQREEMERQLEVVDVARTRAAARVEEARRQRAELVEDEEGVRLDRKEARDAWESVQEEWEGVREEESRLSVERARLDGELSRGRERLESLAATRASLEERIQSLTVEEEELAEEVASSRKLRSQGETELERLFAERTTAEAEFKERENEVQALSEALGEAERKVRAARAAERDDQERRHRLELERSELTSRVERIKDRLEGEWGRPLDALFEEAQPVSGEPEELQVELREIVQALDGLGPVNMLAVEEHEEESGRLDFLTGQRDDLVEARDDLEAAIEEINQTATEVFSETFDAIRTHFRDTFQRLFEGGECDLWLSDPDDPLEAPIEIHASPVGKRTQRIDLLSGGERALTALALLFGIYLVKPSPFCVLDEVDAPLDESNIGRFIRLLQEFKSHTQFVVITHNTRTIEAADWIYGVTMEEPGVSTVVGVRLEEALESAGSAA